MEKKIAIVILNWNGEALLRRFLPSVVAGAGEQAEVVVADNGSTDGSVALLRAEFPHVRLICLPQNYGFADGYNRALEQVEAPYYVLLNSDVETPAGWTTPLLDYMEHHPEVAACQPKLLSYAERDRFEYAGAAGGYLDRYGYPFCRGRMFDVVEQDKGQYDAPAAVLWATGAALMVRSADWHAAGGLDARFFAHMEEVDFCWRLRARGRGVACVPSSHVYHVGGASLAQGNPRKTFLNFRNNLLMLYKNLPESELRGVMRVRCWLDYVAAAKFLLTGDVANARAVRRARREYKRLRPEFSAQRQENLRLASPEPVAERVGFSLLAAYYLRRKRRFSDLFPQGLPQRSAQS